ncbi:hypothetical protein [Aeromicrobium wangtongii]|uniref:hypothetical protein n=1 Tax=Aeromicrobium wangtongii TaxID=2969247 RepID=UPI0020178E46|nr:hypothetical protein [Aeromicrobium wangtongii]MCL3819868.1 hypothetical protein [Aeromicrobium wangtongii]
MSAAAGPRRPYAVAAGLVVVAVALGALFGVIVARAISGYDITRLPDPSGSTVTVGDRSVAVWVSPRDAAVSCDATADGTSRKTLTSTGRGLSLSDGGRTWRRVGVLSGEPGTTFTVSCSGDDLSGVGYADNPRPVRYIVLGVLLAGTAALLMLSAFVLALVTALRRRPDRR